MRKLIACDLDGTLLPKGNLRLDFALETRIKAEINRGTVFAVVSGRDYPSLRKVFDFDSEKIYFCCCCGSVSLKDGKVLYSKPVTAQSIIFALKASEKYGKGLVLCAAGVLYVYGEPAFRGKIKGIYGCSAIEICGSDEIKEPVYKISFYGDNSKPAFDCFAGEDGRYGLRRFYNKNGWEEYINRFAGKAGALTDLQMRLGILSSDTVAAGDDDCDAGMLKRAGRAFAFRQDLAYAVNGIYITDPLDIFG